MFKSHAFIYVLQSIHTTHIHMHNAHIHTLPKEKNTDKNSKYKQNTKDTGKHFKMFDIFFFFIDCSNNANVLLFPNITLGQVLSIF